MKLMELDRIVVTWVFIGCVSCQPVKKETVFSDSDFPIHKELIAQPVEIDELFHPDFMIRRDSFLIVASSMMDTMLAVFKIPSFRCINKQGIQGGGPDDFFAFPMFCETFSSKSLFVWGYTPVTIRKFDLDSAGNLLSKGMYRLNHYEAFNNMSIVDDSLLLYFLPDELKVKKYDLNRGEILKELEFKKEDHGETYFYTNKGVLAANNSRMVYVYNYKKQIDIYDVSTFELIKRIKGTSKYTPPVRGNFYENVQHYMNVVTGNRYFYVLYRGKNFALESQDCEVLEVYDYEGNPIARYSFDIVPNLFVVDEIDNKLYGYNYQMENKLYIYDFGLITSDLTD